MTRFLGMKGRAGRHAKNVARKRLYKTFFGSRRHGRQRKRLGETTPL